MLLKCCVPLLAVGPHQTKFCRYLPNANITEFFKGLSKNYFLDYDMGMHATSVPFLVRPCTISLRDKMALPSSIHPASPCLA